jgi:hypothetical protein
MGNTQKDATVPAPARREVLRALAPRTIAANARSIARSPAPVSPRAALLRNRAALIRVRIALLSTRAALAAVIAGLAVSTVLARAAGLTQAAARGAWEAALASIPVPIRARGRATLAVAERASSPARAQVRAAVRAAGQIPVPAVRCAGCGVRAVAAYLSGIVPARAKTPVAAAAVLALAGTAAAAGTALGPVAIAGPAGPVAAAALGPVPAAATRVPNTTTATSSRRHGRHGRHHRLALTSWRAITEAAAGHHHHHGGHLAAYQRLLPAGLAGAQATLPLTRARAANAALITARALHLHMGIRSAVIAVATAIQESTLENLSYGDRDSLGLFQQRPSAGWGTPAQITNPTYAADAFLHALAAYQRRDPAWASQPLWEAAQGVQRSAYPYAYNQWENQAAHIVAAATRHLL